MKNLELKKEELSQSLRAPSNKVIVSVDMSGVSMLSFDTKNIRMGNFVTGDISAYQGDIVIFGSAVAEVPGISKQNEMLYLVMEKANVYAFIKGNKNE